MWGREKQLMPREDVMIHKMSSFRGGGHSGRGSDESVHIPGRRAILMQALQFHRACGGRQKK